MSRGPGVMQKYLVHTIRVHGKPVTFAELRGIILKADNAPAGAVLRPPVERSLRRALQSLVHDQIIITLGSGGPSDPHRYFLHPLAALVACDKQEFDALCEAFEAEVTRSGGTFRGHRHVRSNPWQ
jgi:hypothetical protein